jgi:hypothetical protein
MTPSGTYGRSWAIAAPPLLISVVLNVANARDGFSSPSWAVASALVTMAAAGALYYALDHAAAGRSRLRSRWTYTVEPGGLVRTRHGKASVIPWDDMAEIYSSSVERSDRRTVEFRIVTTGHDRILIGPAAGNHVRIGEQVLRQASRVRLERTRQTLADGGRVRFGKLWMTLHELGYGGNLTRWRSLRAAHFERQRGKGAAGGFVFRAEETSTINFCTVHVEEIPYLAVFVEMMHLVPVRVENAAKLAGIRAVV